MCSEHDKLGHTYTSGIYVSVTLTRAWRLLWQWSVLRMRLEFGRLVGNRPETKT